MRRVIIESPYAGDVARNERYAERAVMDCLRRGEAPIASHLLFTRAGILDDTKLRERTLGIEAGHAWMSVADCVVVYRDYGVSSGMVRGIHRAGHEGRPVEYRNIGENPESAP